VWEREERGGRTLMICAETEAAEAAARRAANNFMLMVESERSEVSEMVG
jgi:hypothetical protein